MAHPVHSRRVAAPRPGMDDGVMIRVGGVGSSRVHCGSCGDVARLGHPVQRVPGSVLGSVPGAVRIVFFDDGRLFLDDLRLGTGAGHGGAKEDVDDEHNEEEDPKGDAEVQQPQWLDSGTRCYGHCIITGKESVKMLNRVDGHD